MYTFTRPKSIKERRNLLYDLYGEIHGDVEYSQPAVHLANTEACAGWGWGHGGIWDLKEGL